MITWIGGMLCGVIMAIIGAWVWAARAFSKGPF